MSELETSSRSTSTSDRVLGVQPRLSLGNQDENIYDRLSLPTKIVNDLPTYMIWSIFNLLLIPFGILCCYFSYKVSQFKMQNRYGTAKKWSKRTFVLNIISTLLMIGIVITIYMLHYDYVQGNQTRTTGAYIAWQPGR